MADNRSRTLGGVRPSRGIPNPLPGPASPPRQVPGIVSNVPGRLSASSRPPSGSREHGNEGSRGDCTRSGSRLLQPPLSGRKDIRRLETRDRPLPSQRVRTTNPVQDGNCRRGAHLCQRGRLTSLRGPERCVLPDPHPSLLQEVAPFRLGRDGPSVQGALLRTVNRPTGLHESFCNCVSLGPLSRSSTSPVSGRLAGPGILGDQSQAARPRTALALSLPRHSDKRREVRPQPIAVCGVPRYVHRHSGCPSLPHSSSGREIPLDSETVSVTPEPSRPALAGVVGTHVIAEEAGSPWETQDALTTAAPEVPLVLREGSPHLPVPRSRQVEEDLSWWMVRDHLLEGMRFGTPTLDLRLYSDESRSGWGAHLLDRSVSGIWSNQESSLHINLLEMKALFLALQSFQDVVADHRVTAMCDNSTVVAYVNKQGGTVSDSLCSLTGQLLRWTESHNVHLEARYLPGQSNVLADLLSRRNQVLGTEWSLHPQVAMKLIRTWGPPSLDLFATHLNAKLPLYCSLIPDLQAIFEDAFRHPWNDLDTYMFPPFHLVESRGPGQGDSKSLNDSGRPSLAGESVVRGPSPSPDPTTSGTPPVGSTAEPAALQSVPRRRPRPEPSRLATLKRLLRKSGFSSGAALEMSGCFRESTACLYQSQWLSFCGWCRGRGVAPVDVTIALIVDFLIHLRRDKGFSLSAFKGYRSTISLKGVDLSTSRELSMLFRSFSKSCSPIDLRPPAWDVALVLQSLTSP